MRGRLKQSHDESKAIGQRSLELYRRGVEFHIIALAYGIQAGTVRCAAKVAAGELWEFCRNEHEGNKWRFRNETMPEVYRRLFGIEKAVTHNDS